MYPKIIIIIITFLIVLSSVFYFLNFEENKEDLLEYGVKSEVDQMEESLSAINLLWERTLHEMLQDSLWKERDAYDAGHFLMIPLQAAFSFKDQSKINDFHQFFSRFMKDYRKDNVDTLNTLTQLHFLYLASEYLVLTKTYEDQLPDELCNIVMDSIESIWNQPAWQWKICSISEFENMKKRIEWKLRIKEVPRSYCRAIIDEELFTFAIAADLKTILLDESPEFIDEILDIAYEVFSSEVVFLDTESKKWLFQPGVWTDHSDYAYSGWAEIRENLTEKPVTGIATDTSHSHRFPLWLVSLERAFDKQGDLEKAQFIKRLRKGLAEQFFEKVLVPPSDEFPNYRTNNFMDGYNGIYRYNYPTHGLGQGYGPYELSGTMLLGWWSFLPDQSIRDVYCFIASRYPFNEQEIATYLGPDTTRDRHPLIKGKAQFKSGLLELISKLICEYGTKLKN